MTSGAMEYVYVMKVKTKPALSSLYPSERRYSASTVGGLALVHFGLGALSLLLGSLAPSLQGPVLSVACLVPFLAGLLASRRWYIDRNITIFFYGSLFSLIAGILCLIGTLFDLAAASHGRGIISLAGGAGGAGGIEGVGGGLRFLEDTVEPTSSNMSTTVNNPRLDHSFASLTPGILIGHKSNISGYILRIRSTPSTGESHLDESTSEESSTASVIYEEEKKVQVARVTEGAVRGEAGNLTDGSAGITIKSQVIQSFWWKNYEESSRSRILLTVNLMVASLLEISWSVLSAKIALRGMLTRLPDYRNNAVQLVSRSSGQAPKKKPPPPRPDTITFHRHHDPRIAESLCNFSASLHHLRNCLSSSPILPSPQSNREFRERVERFLANQAAHPHRIVQGSCA